jgi:hypothetical protein
MLCASLAQNRCHSPFHGVCMGSHALLRSDRRAFIFHHLSRSCAHSMNTSAHAHMRVYACVAISSCTYAACGKAFLVAVLTQTAIPTL